MLQGIVLAMPRDHSADGKARSALPCQKTEEVSASTWSGHSPPVQVLLDLL